jgi:hypothetical protein
MADVDLIALNGRWWDYELYGSDGVRLVIVGSTDLTYHHDVAVTFHEVTYLEMPAAFSHPTFRLPPTKSSIG